jgi:hypothetical protein
LEFRPFDPITARRRSDDKWLEPLTASINKWMRSAGVRDRDAWEPTVALYRSWQNWCRANDHRPHGPPRFAMALGRLLNVQRRKHGGRGFRGFRLHGGGG